MSQRYTVVGIYTYSDDESFVDDIKAMTPAHAAYLSMQERDKGDVNIIAVFVGAHADEFDPSVNYDSEEVQRRMEDLDKEMEAEL